jgi:hypothetical protein
MIVFECGINFLGGRYIDSATSPRNSIDDPKKEINYRCKIFSEDKISGLAGLSHHGY